LTPGGSSTHLHTTVHIIQRTEHTLQLHGKKVIRKNYKQEKNNKQEEKITILGSAGRAPSLRVIPWHLSYN
jgi:hypothetical protein